MQNFPPCKKRTADNARQHQFPQLHRERGKTLRGRPERGTAPKGAKRLEFLKNSCWGAGGMRQARFPKIRKNCPEP